MAIRELFGQAVIGSDVSDARDALIQINRREINLASAHCPLHPQSYSYLEALDVETRYLRAGPIAGPDSLCALDIAHFSFNHAAGLVFDSVAADHLPHLPGRDTLLGDLSKRASLFSQVVGWEEIRGCLRVIAADKDNILWHPDTRDKRGLQTLMGKVNTLWLPDQHLPKTLLIRYIYPDGRVDSQLHVPFDLVHQHAQQIENHHMSIHKGDVHDNPLYHTAPGLNKALNMSPGARVLLVLDQA